MLKFYAGFCICFLAVGLWASDTSSVHWGYGKNDGPKNWGDLDKQFALCKVGKAQTPIDIIPSQTKKIKQNIILPMMKRHKILLTMGILCRLI